MFEWIKNIFGTKETSQTEKIISTGAAAFYLTVITFVIHKVMDKQGFEKLIKPDTMLPPSLMGLGWFISFLFLVLAAYYAWNHYASNRARVSFAVFYGLSGMLLALWAKWSFGTLALDKALISSILLVILAEGLTLSAHYSNHRASHLTLPFLAWMVYQTYLGATLLLLNA